MANLFHPIIIVAVDEAGGFGKDGRIPWQLPEDLQRFRMITQGHICVMGRRTYQDILRARRIRDQEKGITEPIQEILRGRESFVVTSNDSLETPGATKIKDFREVLERIPSNDRRQIFAIGGKQLFIQALSWSEQIMMTIVKGSTYECDVSFPIEVLNKKWRIVSGQETEKAYFVVYNRK